MKKLILALIILGFYSYSFAGKINKYLDIIPNLGLNFSEIKGDYNVGTIKGHLGAHAGINLRIGNRIYVNTGVNFYRTSNEITEINMNTSQISRWENTETYLRIPALAGYKLIKIGKDNQFNLRVEGGICIQLLQNFKSISTTGSIPFNQDDLKNSNVNAVIGAGFDIFNITCDVHYQAGIGKAFESSRPNLNEIRHNVIQVSLGFKIFN